MEKLPLKWYVLRTLENHKILNDWNNNKYNNSKIDACKNDRAYMYSDKKYDTSELEKGYTEITFETFMKYIVNKEPQTTEYLIHN